MSYDDISAGITYAFNISSGKLTSIASLLDNTSIVVEYHGQQYPVLFTHSNGKSLNITYADSGLISYVDLLDKENVLEKTRLVMCLYINIHALKFCFQIMKKRSIMYHG